MESKAKFLGHPIHPMLIVFPMGLLGASVLFDILYLVTDNQLFAVTAFYNIAGGIIGGVIAAVFGFIDYWEIPKHTRAKRIGTFHGFGNLAVILLFSFSWLFRMNAPEYIPPFLALASSFLGFAIAGVTGWLGGELVDRLGVGVDPGANVNAPSSLAPVDAGDTAYVAQVPVTGEPAENEIIEKDEP
jgi:uncharacterized membrane protein